jgi:hypothetical protein
MMSENPANRERTRYIDTRVHYLRELVRDGHVKLLKCAGPQNVGDTLTKSLASSSCQTSAIRVGDMYLFFSLLFLSQVWTVPDGVLKSSHLADIKSHAPSRLRNTSSESVCMCVCMCVNMTYDATINTEGCLSSCMFRTFRAKIDLRNRERERERERTGGGRAEGVCGRDGRLRAAALGNGRAADRLVNSASPCAAAPE